MNERNSVVEDAKGNNLKMLNAEGNNLFLTHPNFIAHSCSSVETENSFV
jgi:hypothetical protein